MSTRIVVSWVSTGMYLAGTIALFVVGIAMVQAADVWVLLVFGGILVITAPIFLAAIVLRGIGTAACPGCGAAIEVMPFEKPVRCDACQGYWEVSNRHLVDMPASYVAGAPTFTVTLPWKDTRRGYAKGISTAMTAKDFVTDKVHEAITIRTGPDRILDAVWPAKCCVCGGPVHRSDSIGQTVVCPPDGPIGRDRQFRIVVPGIPHCSEHKAGVAIGGDAIGLSLKFRSYPYRTEFRTLNDWTKSR